MNNKIKLFSLATAGAMFLSGCSLMGTKDLTEKDDQIDFLKEAEEAFQDKDGFKGEGDLEDGKITMIIKGDDYSTDIESGEFSMKSIKKGDDCFSFASKWYTSEKWYKMSSCGENLFNETFEFDFKEEDLDDDSLKYDGIKEEDGKEYYVFIDDGTEDKDEDEDDSDNGYFEEEESEDPESFEIWFDVETKLAYKILYLEGEDKDNFIKFTYDDLDIEIPSDYGTAEEYEKYRSIYNKSTSHDYGTAEEYEKYR